MSQIRADNITNRQGTGAPIFVNGIRVTGLTSIANIVAGTGTFSGAVSIGGTLTYEDVTNVDSVGVVTARNGINISGGNLQFNGTNVINSARALYNLDSIKLADGKEFKLGSSDDLKIFHDGSHSYISEVGNGALKVKGDDIRFENASAAERLRITTTGMQVTGNQTNNIVAMGANDVDCSAGSYFTKTITGATTFTFSNVPSGVEFSFTMEITLNGSNAITWPSSVKWNADTAPALTDGKTQLFMFVTTNGGTRFRGSALVDYVN